MENKITLRPYQIEFINDIRSEIAKNPSGHIACNLVGGGGKTVIFTWLAMNSITNGWRVFVFSDRHELITQASGSFKKFGLKHTFINPRAKFPDYDATATICSSQTFRRRYEIPEWAALITRPKTMVIIDEADRNEFGYLFYSGLLDKVLTLGFSGTFARTGNMTQLGIQYDVIVKGASPRKLVELGYLVPDKYYAVSEPDLSGVEIDPRTGDFNPNQLYQKFHKKELYEGMIDNWMTHARNSKTLAFGTSQVHAINMAVEFNKAGIDAKFLISGITKPKKPLEWKNEGERALYERRLEAYMTSEQYKHLSGDRKKVVDSFRKNEFPVLTNAGLFGTGFDVPDLETVIIKKSTLSLREYLQISWRVSRISPETGKIHGTILDFGNHAHRKEHSFGRMLDDRNYSLWHDKSGGNGVVPTKLCDPNKEDKNKKRGCGRLIAVFYQDCPFCSFHFATEKELKEAELREIAYADKIPEEVLISTMQPKQLQAHAKLKGYKKPVNWIGRVLYARGGAEMVYSGLGELGYKRNWIRNYVLKYIR